MALTMTRPTKHPKTGTFLVRVAIPAPLREMTQRLFGVRAELRENLKTKDPAEAKRLAPAAVGRLQAMLERTREVVAAAPEQPLAREIAALAGEFYRRQVGASGTADEQAIHWEITLLLLRDDPTFTAPHEGEAVDPASAELDRQRAVGLLERHGFATDDDTVQRVAAAVTRADIAYRNLLKRRAEGDWSPDPNLITFPELPSRPASGSSASASGCEFTDLLSGWAKDRGLDLAAKPIARAAYDRKRTLERLAKFLGHRDAAQVSVTDAVRWKQEMQGRDLAVATIRNDLSKR